MIRIRELIEQRRNTYFRTYIFFSSSAAGSEVVLRLALWVAIVHDLAYAEDCIILY